MSRDSAIMVNRIGSFHYLTLLERNLIISDGYFFSAHSQPGNSVWRSHLPISPNQAQSRILRWVITVTTVEKLQSAWQTRNSEVEIAIIYGLYYDRIWKGER